VRYLYIRSSFCYSEQVAYTTRTITVPSTLSSVADINFNVSLTHSYLSDVEMEVISPQGTTVNYLIGVVVIQIVPLLSYDDSGADLACAATSANGSSFSSISCF
jgi:subtilisin-like proprotein convertase family protein